MSKPLSPAAQAVRTAIEALLNSSAGLPTMEEVAAAALRAVADQVVPEKNPLTAGHGQIITEALRQLIRFDILAIAAELEGCDG